MRTQYRKIQNRKPRPPEAPTLSKTKIRVNLPCDNTDKVSKKCFERIQAPGLQVCIFGILRFVFPFHEQ